MKPFFFCAALSHLIFVACSQLAKEQTPVSSSSTQNPTSPVNSDVTKPTQQPEHSETGNCEVKQVVEKRKVLKLRKMSFDRDGGGDFHFNIVREDSKFVVTVTKEDFKETSRQKTIDSSHEKYSVLKAFFDGSKEYEILSEVKSGDCPKADIAQTGSWSRWTLVQEDGKEHLEQSFPELLDLQAIANDDKPVASDCVVESVTSKHTLGTLKEIKYDRDGGGDFHFSISIEGSKYVLKVTQENFSASARKLVIDSAHPKHGFVKNFFNGGSQYSVVTEKKTGNCAETANAITGTWSRWTLTQADNAKIENPNLAELADFSALASEAK